MSGYQSSLSELDLIHLLKVTFPENASAELFLPIFEMPALALSPETDAQKLKAWVEETVLAEHAKTVQACYQEEGVSKSKEEVLAEIRAEPQNQITIPLAIEQRLNHYLENMVPPEAFQQLAGKDVLVKCRGSIYKKTPAGYFPEGDFNWFWKWTDYTPEFNRDRAKPEFKKSLDTLEKLVGKEITLQELGDLFPQALNHDDSESHQRGFGLMQDKPPKGSASGKLYLMWGFYSLLNLRLGYAFAPVNIVAEIEFRRVG